MDGNFQLRRLSHAGSDSHHEEFFDKYFVRQEEVETYLQEYNQTIYMTKEVSLMKILHN